MSETETFAAAEVQVAAPQSPQIAMVPFFGEVNPATVDHFVARLSRYATIGTEVAYVPMSSPGGDVSCGLALYNIAIGLGINVVTHNVGTVESAAVMLYLAGSVRLTTPHSAFMLHGIHFQVESIRLDPPTMALTQSRFDLGHEMMKGIYKDRTHLTDEKISDIFASQMHLIRPDEALDLGIATGIEHFQLLRGTHVSTHMIPAMT